MFGAFQRAGAALLFLAGAAMTLLAVLVEERGVVAAALVGFGAALMSMAVLLPRLVGRLKIGAQGFEAELLAAVEEQAQAQGLSADETRKVIEVARTDTDAWVTWLDQVVQRAGTGAADGAARGPIDRLAEQYVLREQARPR